MLCFSSHEVECILILLHIHNMDCFKSFWVCARIHFLIWVGSVMLNFTNKQSCALFNKGAQIWRCQGILDIPCKINSGIILYIHLLLIKNSRTNKDGLLVKP